MGDLKESQCYLEADLVTAVILSSFYVPGARWETLSGAFSAVERLCAALCRFESFLSRGRSDVVISMRAEPSLLISAVVLNALALWSGEGERRAQ